MGGIRSIKVILIIAVGVVLMASRFSTSIPKQLRDFEAFKTVLENKEGVLDLNISRDSFQMHLDLLKKELSESDQPLLEQYKLFSKTLARIECGHTQMYPTRALWDDYASNAIGIPFDYRLVGKRLFVAKLDMDDWNNAKEEDGSLQNWQRISPDSEILSIDHKTPAELMEGMGEYISSDKDEIDFKYYQAAQLFEFYRHLAFPLGEDSIEVTYVEKDDTITINVKPTSIPRNSIRQRNMEYAAMFNRNSTSYGHFKIIDDKYAYFRFKSFISCYGEGYNRFLRRAFVDIKYDSIQHVVIDLRGNTGGVMQYELMKYFVGEGDFIGKYIVQKPKIKGDSKYIKKFNSDFFKHWKMSKAQAFKVKLDEFDKGRIFTDEVDSSLVFKGDIVVITDEGTFSSAGILTSNLKTLVNAKIVGQPAGGTFYAGNSGTLEAELPESKLMMYINPNTFYSQISDEEYNPSIKNPDILIYPRPLPSNKLDAIYFEAAISLFEQ